MNATYYEILDITAQASEAEIKTAYRKMLRQTHPDTGGNQTLFRLVQEAWEVLSDPITRSAYDRDLRYQKAHKPKEKYSTSENNTSNIPAEDPRFEYIKYYEYVKQREAEEQAARDLEERKIRLEQERVDAVVARWTELGRDYFKAPDFDTALSWKKFDTIFTRVTYGILFLLIVAAGINAWFQLNQTFFFADNGVTGVVAYIVIVTVSIAALYGLAFGSLWVIKKVRSFLNRKTKQVA